jgi:thiamine pyrophosphokinase
MLRVGGGKRVLGVLAGGDMADGLLQAWVRSADLIVAADGAANRLVSAGITPHVIVGDLDSVASSVPGADILYDPDPSRTDCDKLLSLLVARGHEEVTLASVEGDLVDHFLATLQSSARSSLRVRLALRRGMGWLLKGGQSLTVRTRQGDRLSLLPLVDSRGATFEGAVWPLERADLSALGLTSISNQATGEIVRAKLVEGAALLVVERAPEDLPDWPDESEWSLLR